MLRLCIVDLKLNFATLSVTFCLFFLYIIIIPLLIGFSTDLLYHYHLGIIWMCIVFSFLPERFFHQDFEDGSIELYFLSSCAIQPIFITKLFSYWCLKITGIVLSFPIFSFVYHFEQSKEICITIILGSFVFTLICGIYSCLTVGIKSNTWNSIQHFTALPTLLPLILLCTTIQGDFIQIYALLGFVCLFLWIYWVFVSITFETILSH